jgi:cytochrome b561
MDDSETQRPTRRFPAAHPVLPVYRPDLPAVAAGRLRWLGCPASRGRMVRQTRIDGGAALGVIPILSILWRRTGGRQLPPPGNKLVTFLADAVQVVLNLLLLAPVLVGLSFVGLRGTNLFNVYPITGYDPDNEALLEQLMGVHVSIAWTIIGIAAFHAAAALFHHYVWKDGVLDRIRLGGGKAKAVT